MKRTCQFVIQQEQPRVAVVTRETAVILFAKCRRQAAACAVGWQRQATAAVSTAALAAGAAALAAGTAVAYIQMGDNN